MRRDRRMFIAGLVLWVVAGPASAGAEAARFVVVPEKSTVEYVSGTQLGEFRGATGHISGEVLFDAAAPQRAQASIAIQALGLRSENAARDHHLHDKVLEIARFPAITFTAREFRPAPAANGMRGEGLLVGVLALHGVERPVNVPIRYTLEGGLLQASGRFSVNLADFALTPPRLLGLKVRDEVVIEAQLVASR